MPKKRIRGVFLEILPSSKKYTQWEEFYLDTKSEINDISFTSELSKLKQEYLGMLNDDAFLNKLNELAQKEAQIIQHHCIINPHITLSLYNNERNGKITQHIIARAPFFVNKQIRREMRIYLNKLSYYKGKTIVDLKYDDKFMAEVKTKMKKAMMDEMETLLVKNIIKKYPTESKKQEQELLD